MGTGTPKNTHRLPVPITRMRCQVPVLQWAIDVKLSRRVMRVSHEPATDSKSLESLEMY